MPVGYPFLLRGLWVSGLGIPTVGAAYGHGVKAVNGETVVVDWEGDAPLPIGEASLARQAYLDGQLVGAAEGSARSVAISGLREGATHRFDLLPLSIVQHLQRPVGSPIFAGALRGNRACLQWADQPDETDFAAYVIYWDEGLGGDPETELAVIQDRDQLEYRSAELAAGTYQFALAYRDLIGNESALGTPLEIEVPAVPLPVTDLEASYDEETRRVTLTWSNPGGQPSSVERLLICDNWMPGCRYLAPHANSDPAYRRDSVAASAETWTSNNLWEGGDSAGALAPWRFAVVAILRDGLGTALAVSAEVVLPLLETAGVLEEIDVPPPAPELLRLDPVAGGALRATWRIASLENVTRVEALIDGVEIEEADWSASESEYTWTTDPLTNGQTYEVMIRAYNGVASYAQSNALSATADGAAPTGDKALTGGLCY